MCSKLFFPKNMKQICIVHLKMFARIACVFNFNEVLKSSEEVLFHDL